MFTVLSVLAMLYPAVAVVLVLGMRRLPRSVPRADAECPTVSVVVSARNEIESIPACAASVLALDYPGDRLQIILVDDRSTDGTGRWLDELAAREPRVTVLHTEQLPDNGLEAKARGVAHGISRATGDWILITDADARVPREWARHLMGAVDARTTIVGGTVLVTPTRWWGAIERSAWAFLQTVNIGVAGWGVPVVAVGPNMGIRRATYVAAGGLERARFKIAEDLALYRMARDAGGGAQAYADPETTVRMDEVPTPGHIPSQLRRWVAGALEQGPVYSIGVPLAIAWGVLVAAFVLAGWTWSPGLWLAFVMVKQVLDARLLGVLATRLAAPELRNDVLRVFVIQLFAMVFLPPSLIVTRRMQWRGANYAVKYE